MTTVNDKEPEATSEIDVLAGNPSLLHLPVLDIDVEVERLRTRELFKFLKILTTGAGAALADLRIGADTAESELAEQIMAILLISVPEAGDEVIDFLKAMVRPLGLVDPERSKADHDKNVALYTDLYSKFNNPDLADTLALLVRVVQIETPNLLALGKQIAALLPSAAKLTNSSKKPSKKSTPAA